MAFVYEAYNLGIKINDTTLPDPSTYAWKDSDLDASGERDAEGTLHRDKVGTKHHAELSWNVLSWATLGEMLNLLEPLETFTATLPLPGGTTYEGTFYAGDREVSMNLMAGERAEWFGSLSFNLIEI